MRSAIDFAEVRKAELEARSGMPSAYFEEKNREMKARKEGEGLFQRRSLRSLWSFKRSGVVKKTMDGIKRGG